MKLAPIKAKKDIQIIRLKTDNYSTDDFWILLNKDTVNIHEQRSGETSKQNITIPRKDFDRLVKWYLREQELRNVMPLI